VKVMREACEGCEGVPWLLNDKSQVVGVEPGPEYARIVMGRIKGVLRELELGGKFGRDGFFIIEGVLGRGVWFVGWW